MSWLHSTAGALRMEQKLFWRNKGAAIATFALPILMGIGLPLAAHQDSDTVDGIGKDTYFLTGMIGIVILWGGLWQIVTALVSRRDELILKRLRASQLPESAILTGQILNSVLLVFAQVLVVAVGGGIVVGVPIPENPLLVLAAVLLGILVFVVLGVALTGWVPSAGVAPVMCVPFLLVSMFCSGVFIPLESLPSWLQGIAKVLPLTPVVNGVRTGWFGRDFAHATVDAPLQVAFSPAFAAMGFGFAVLAAGGRSHLQGQLPLGAPPLLSRRRNHRQSLRPRCRIGTPAFVAEGGIAPGRYQILAAINAVHTSARDVRDTDWSQVLALYDQLARVDPSPIVVLNRAVAVAELDGPEVALAAVDRLADTLAGYHAFHATRADLLRRLSRGRESRAAYDSAIETAGNTAEIAYLGRRRDQLG